MTTFATLPAEIDRYIRKAVPAAIAEGVGTSVGVEVADRVRVLSGQNRRSTHGNRGEPKAQDPGLGVFPPPTRTEFRAEFKGLKFDEPSAITQGAPHSAAREAKDGAVQSGIAAARTEWKRRGEAAGKAATRG